MSTALVAFVSYSHKDEIYFEALGEHLTQLQHDGLIEIWHDRKLSPGSAWADEIDEKIEAADLIILLVSASFIASKYCYGVEMKHAMELHAVGKARLVPIIVRPCDWNSAPFAAVKGLPKDGRAITTWPNSDEAWLDVAKQLRQLCGQINQGEKSILRRAQVTSPSGLIDEHCPRGDINHQWSVFHGKTSKQIALLGLLLIAVMGSLLYFLSQGNQPAIEFEASGTPRVVFLAFEHPPRDPENEWRAVAVPELLAAELAIVPLIGSRIEDVATALDFNLDPEFLAEVWQSTGAHAVIAGRLDRTVSGEEIRVVLEIHAARSGQSTSLEASAKPSDLLVLTSGLARDLSRILGVSPRPRGIATRDNLVLSPEIAEMYSRGIARLRLQDFLEAHEHFAAAIEREPGNPLLRAALADTLWQLGKREESREAASAASQDAARLARDTRLSFHARDLEAQERWKQAAAVYAVLWNAGDENGVEIMQRLDQGLRLALVQARAHWPKAAEATLLTLRQLPPPAREDPRIDLTEAEVAKRLPSYQQQLEAARSAAARSETTSPFIFARARHLEGEALKQLNRTEEAEAVLEKARNIYTRAGHRQGEATAITEIGNIYWARGNYRDALASYNRAADLYGVIGNRRMEARLLANKGMARSALGDVRIAIGLFEEAVRRSREVGDDLAEANGQLLLVEEFEIEGRFAEAIKAHREAVKILQVQGEEWLDASHLTSLGRLLLRQGELSEAHRTLKQAVEISDQTQNIVQKNLAAGFLAEVLYHQGEFGRAKAIFEDRLLGLERGSENRAEYALMRQLYSDLLLSEGLLDAAQTGYQEALKIQAAAEGQTEAAETRLSLARLRLHQGKSHQAEQLTRRALQDFSSSPFVLATVKSRGILAECLLAQGKLAEAGAEVESAWQVFAGKQIPLYVFPLTITRARILAATGRIDEAQKTLRAALMMATERSFDELGLEVELAQGEVLMLAGKADVGNTRIERVEKNAKGQGFGLVAQKAARVRKRWND